MKINFTILVGIFSLFGFAFSQTTKTLYDFKVTDIEGKEFNMAATSKASTSKLLVKNTSVKSFSWS